MSDNELCTRGPCWEGFIFVGPKKGVRGSCRKPSKIKESHDCYSAVHGKNVHRNGNNNQKGGSEDLLLPIPTNVQETAQMGLLLRNSGFQGGTETGWSRGEQLSNDKMIDLESLADMRTWFARHGPDAVNGGTSYPGFCEWKSMNMPTKLGQRAGKGDLKGAVSWLLWGGDDAYLWLKSDKVRKLLKKHFPKRKSATAENNLEC